MMKDFAEKTVIVTGSGQGIGREIARRFACGGANLVISDVNPETTEEAAEELRQSGHDALGAPADVTDAEEVDELFSAARERFGSIDVVVNNAGITHDTLLVRMSEEDWDNVIRVNLRGAFLVSRAAGKIMMKQRSGRIVNIASVVGMRGNVGQSNYSASKAGLIGLTKSAAKELAPRGVTVNAVAPGFIRTGMTEAMSDQARKTFLKTIPLQRQGEPSDVADAVTFLASDRAGYITGQVLSVCGGINI